ncbi:MAG: fasciclin domain-containing protein [Sandaracinaceae bacterium]|nr:fasciclin domain-containing protein [Sandaracinaceae bacterium]
MDHGVHRADRGAQPSAQASRFLQLLEPAQLVQALTEMQGGTVFVPTNAALEALPAAIEQDPAALRHSPGGTSPWALSRPRSCSRRAAWELFDQQRTSLPVVTSRGATTVGPAHVIRPDLRCEGVTIHLVDSVLPVGAFDPSESPNPFQVNLWRMPAE